SSTGLYTAPPVSADATATVTATSVADATKSANASAAITAPPPPSGSFSLSPTSASFGSVTVGTTSAASDVRVTNTGTTGVSVSSITVSGAFALSSTDCSPTHTWNGVLATGYGLVTPLNTSLVTSHSQPLSGLAPNTRYHYRVKSRDAAGNLAVSRDFTFKTKPN